MAEPLINLDFGETRSRTYLISLLRNNSKYVDNLMDNRKLDSIENPHSCSGMYLLIHPLVTGASIIGISNNSQTIPQ